MRKSSEKEIILNSLIGKPLEQAMKLAGSSGFPSESPEKILQTML